MLLTCFTPSDSGPQIASTADTKMQRTMIATTTWKTDCFETLWFSGRLCDIGIECPANVRIKSPGMP